MNKSEGVPLRFLSAIAKMFRGPGELMEFRYCVHEDGKVVPDSCCESSSLGTRFHWICGGSSRGHIGGAVEGGGRAGAMLNPGFGFRQKGGG